MYRWPTIDNSYVDKSLFSAIFFFFFARKNSKSSGLSIARADEFIVSRIHSTFKSRGYCSYRYLRPSAYPTNYS